MASARRAALRQHKNARKRLLKGAGQGSGGPSLSLSQQLQLPPVLPSDTRFEVGGGGGTLWRRFSVTLFQLPLFRAPGGHLEASRIRGNEALSYCA